MPTARSWIFQATPATTDLPVELRSGDELSWLIRRYGRELQAGDHVYYWQAGRDAGVYGVGRVQEVNARQGQGRYAVRTTHDRALFAPITRAELRADPALVDLAVLRQPRGTVFPLTPAQAIALAQRAGEAADALVVPAARVVRGQLRLSSPADADAMAAVLARRAHGEDVLALLIVEGNICEVRRVETARRRRDGDVALRLSGAVPMPIPALPAGTLAAASEEGAAIFVALPVYADAAQRGPASAVAEAPAAYGTALFAPAASAVRGELDLPGAIVAQLVAAVNAGRHVVLMGLPGTGKTTLAIGLARAAQGAGLTNGYLLATATGDWTTFDTIGGLVPSADGTLRFAEGVVLRALREDRWLILDELNRADIDRAFGPLLTVLAGAAVDLPTVTVDGRPLRIEPAHERGGLDADGAVYRVGRHWRIIGTMNTLDRAALFSFSLAFARRFAFVLAPAPDSAATVALVRERVALDAAGLEFVERVLQASPRSLGPAIILDTARYMAERAGPLARAEAVGSLILPQYEGLDAATVTAFVDALTPALGRDGAAVLRSYVAAWYGEG